MVESLYSQSGNAVRLLTELNRYIEHNDIKDNVETMRKLATLRCRDIVIETMAEYQRKGNYVRIYPTRGSDMYDQFFS